MDFAPFSKGFLKKMKITVGKIPPSYKQQKPKSQSQPKSRVLLLSGGEVNYVYGFTIRPSNDVGRKWGRGLGAGAGERGGARAW